MREKKHIKEAIDTEGDINLSPRRLDWSREYIDENSQKLLLEDSKYFLHQSLSTPCLNVLGARDCGILAFVMQLPRGQLLQRVFALELS